MIHLIVVKHKKVSYTDVNEPVSGGYTKKTSYILKLFMAWNNA